MRKKTSMKSRMLSLLLLLAMLVPMLPAFSFGSSAAGYDIPKAGDKAWVWTSAYVKQDGTVTNHGSSRPSNAYMATDSTGKMHSIRNLTFRDAGYGGSSTPNYNPDLSLYCIQFGVDYPSSNFEYTAESPSSSSYWSGLNQTAKEGILLVLGFGYPGSTLASLGVSGEGHAIAATQILLWEFQSGRRTSYSGNASNTDLYNSAIKGTGAETAYWKILSLAKAYKESAGYSFSALQSNSDFVIWSKSPYQTMATYVNIGNPPPPAQKNGYIEVNKKDPNGNNLSGAEFTVYNSSGTKIATIGPTNSSGYAISSGGKTSPSIPYGTYFIKETKAPTGYQLSSETWTRTLDSNTSNGGITITAVNQSQSGSWAPTVTKTLSGKTLTAGQFSFTLSESGKVLQTKTNAANGSVAFDKISYTVADIGTHTYTVAEVKGNAGGISYDSHTVTYTVTVSAGTGITLNVSETHSGSTTFSNGYSAQGSFTPTATKKLTGADLTAGQFSFTLSENGKVLQTKTNAADGSISFDTINYTLPDVGTHTYTITEVKGSEAGISYDSHTLTYTVTVSDAGNGTLTVVSSASGSTVFGNYQPSGSFTPTASKVLEGDELTAGQFSFTLSEGDKVLQTKTNDANGNIPFDPISYTLSDVGTHTYTITEVKGNAGGISYDSHTLTYTVTVSYSGSGTALTVTSTATGSTVFENEYNPEIGTTATVCGDKEVTVSKQITIEDVVEYKYLKVGKEYTLTGVLMDKSTGKPLLVDGKEVTSEVTFTPETENGTVTVTFEFDGSGGIHTETQIVVFETLYKDGIEVAVHADINDEGQTITVNPYTSVTVTKTWNDNSNQDGKRADVQLTLIGSDGSERTGTIKLGESSFTWEQLPIYSEDGEKIVYTLYEAKIDGYTAEIIKSADGYGFTVTNTHTPERTFITVYKVWEDGNDQDGLRADVQMTLTGSDGSVYYGTIKQGDDSYNSFTWYDLPKYADGKAITYTVTEAAIDGYTTTISPTGAINPSKGEYEFWITNTHTPETTEFEITKVWNDNSNQDGIRPTEITVTIEGSDGHSYTATVTGSGNSWSYTFKNLPKYNNGELIVYTIVDESHVSGYEAKIEGSTVTNTHIPEITAVTVTKVWADGNNQDGIRTDVYLTLTGSDGSVYTGVIKLGESTFTWTDLPVNVNGKKITYSLSEAEMKGYTAEIVQSADGYGFVVTNTHTPEEIAIPVTKIWQDNSNQLNARPTNITVVLYGSDGSQRSATFKGDGDEWTYTFAHLPKYADGKLIEYTIDEQPVYGYTTVVDGYTVTNTLVYGRLHITKTAEDGLTEGLQFRVYGTAHNGQTVDVVAVTGADGIARIDYILPGVYDVTEINTPDRYVQPATQMVIVTGDDNDPQITAISFYNELKRMSITVTKTAEDSELVGLAGFKFRLTGVDWLGDEIDITLETDENGIVVFENLLAAEYTVTEVDTDVRYVVPADEIVNLTWGKDESVSIHNELKRMTITVTKTAEDSELVGLAGFKFGLTGIDYMGNAIDITLATDENGIVVFENLLAAEYTITEVDTDIRYVVPADQEVNLTWGKDESVEVYNELKRMTITVNKTAEDSELVGLAGFKFRLTGTDYLGNEIDVVGVTDENGVVEFSDLLAAEYTITEVDTDVRYVVPADEIVNLTWGKDESVSIHNELKRMTITVNKTAEDGILAGHKFRLTGTDYLGNEIDIIGETNEEGVIVFENLLKGEYTIAEVDTDVRYIVPNDQNMTVTWSVDESVDFENLLKYWNLTITKTDETTGKPVEGAVYGIYQNGELLDEYTTDENGSFTTQEYLCGESYTLKEITPASGYTLNTEAYALDGTDAESCTVVLNELTGEVTDTPTHVVITKTDLTTGKPLPGAEITIYDADGNEVFKGVTDENGEIEAFYLPIGKYTFKETYAPDGYKMNPQTFEFEILSDGTIVGDTEIKDEPYTVTLTKYETDTTKPVVGAVVKLYNAKGEVIGEYTTDANGQIKLFQLTPGLYFFEEVSAPQGFKLDSTLHGFVLNEDGSVTGDTVFYNALIEVQPPKTGDNTLLYSALTLLSLMGGALLLGKRRRQSAE